MLLTIGQLGFILSSLHLEATTIETIDDGEWEVLMDTTNGTTTVYGRANTSTGEWDIHEPPYKCLLNRGG